MSIFGLATCVFNRHDPDRKEVKWNGHDYVGECRHCNVPIVRVSRRHWRKQVPKGQASDNAPG